LPAERMKGGREHRVPLSECAMSIINHLHQARMSEFVFPGFKRECPLNNSALEAVLRRAQANVTVHGFRSAFRDWAGLEAALAHAIENKTEAAYRRSDALEKRRKLMTAWAANCSSVGKEASGKVASLRRGRLLMRINDRRPPGQPRQAAAITNRVACYPLPLIELLALARLLEAG
jgi:hypothetical protein